MFLLSLGGNVAALCCTLVVSAGGTMLAKIWGNVKWFLELLS